MQLNLFSVLQAFQILQYTVSIAALAYLQALISYYDWKTQPEKPSDQVSSSNNAPNLMQFEPVELANSTQLYQTPMLPQEKTLPNEVTESQQDRK